MCDFIHTNIQNIAYLCFDMKWIGERISFKDNKDNISFVIYPPRLGKKKWVMVLWYVLWLLIGGYVTSQFFEDYTQEQKIALFVFMGFWLYFSIRVFRSILYVYFGREYIKLDENSLRIKAATGSYGKSRQYFIENISKLSVEVPKDSSIKKVYEDSPWVSGSNRIEFEYFGKTYSFGRKLDEKDAEMMFKILTRRIERYLNKKK